MKKYYLSLFVLAAVTFTAYGLISTYAFDSYPFTADEHNYLKQAELFSQMRIREDVGGIQTPWLAIHSIGTETSMFSKYPPGHSVLLALGVLVGQPQLVGPLLATLALVLLSLFLRTFVGAGWSLVGFALCATNPYFIGYSCSFFAQSSALFFLMSAVYLARRYTVSEDRRFLVGFGIALGVMLATRQLDAVCAIAAFSIFAFFSIKTWLRHIYWVVPIVGFALAMSTYHSFLSGNFGLSAVPRTADLPIGAAFVDFPHNLRKFWNWYAEGLLIRTLPNVAVWLFAYSGGVLLLLACVGVGADGMGRRWKAFLGSVLFFFLGAYSFASILGWPVYGARYYFPTFIIFASFATLGLRAVYSKVRCWRPNRNRYFGVAVAACTLVLIFGWQLTGSHSKVRELSRRFDFVEYVWTDIGDKCPDKSYFELPGLPQEPFYAHFISTGLFKRNSHPTGLITYNKYLDGKRILILHDLHKSSPRERRDRFAKLERDYPDYERCEYHFPQTARLAKIVSDNESELLHFSFRSDNWTLPGIGRYAF